jgi:hypothetical protein
LFISESQISSTSLSGLPSLPVHHSLLLNRGFAMIDFFLQIGVATGMT